MGFGAEGGRSLSVPLLVLQHERFKLPKNARRLGPKRWAGRGLDHIPTSWYSRTRMSRTPINEPGPGTREKLLQAAIHLVRRHGFAGTTVDDICWEAGVTKGAFFHCFPNKEAMGTEAARFWSNWTGGLFETAAYHDHPDPLQRVLSYLDLRESLLEGPLEAFTCFAGTTVQECFASSESIRTACADSITGHAATLESDFEFALERRGGIEGVTGASLALHTQAVLQGAFVLAKATGGAGIVHESIAHLRRYLIQLLGPEEDSSRGSENV